MNLLIFTTSMLCGGAERVTANLANHWADKGWNVSIVTLASIEMDFYELHPTVRRITLNPVRGNLARGSGNPLTAVVNNLRRITTLRRVLRAVQPDIALAVMLSNNVLLALAAIGMRDITTIRYMLLPAILILITPARHRLKWRRRRSTLIVFVAIGALLILYQGAIRTTGFAAARQADVSLTQGMFGHDHFVAMIIAIDLADKTGFYMEPIAPFFVTHFIPRRIWPDKPYPQSWLDYNSAWTQGHAFNVTPSITGQYYLNWGFFGVLYIGFFIGWLARFCEVWFARLDIQRQLMSATVAALLLSFLFLSFRFFYPLYFAYPLFGFLAYRLLSRRMPRKYRVAALPRL